MKRHLLLLGLPGSGKSTAGRLAAGLLAAPFVDIDEEIVQIEEYSIARIFTERGEAAFRELERAAVRRALAGTAAVVAPGGGWAAQPGNLEEVAERAFTVYLDTTPETAAARAAPEATRPLLEGADPRRRMRELLTAREVFYVRAEARVVTDGRSPSEIAKDLAALARFSAGW